MLTHWSAWRYFGKVIERQLGLDVTHVAWTNLAKCRVAIERAPDPVVRVCQQDFPIRQAVEAIRPAVVLSCALNARRGGGLVTTWRTPNAEPFAWTWHGRQETDAHGRKIGVWAPEVAAKVRELLAADDEHTSSEHTRRWTHARQRSGCQRMPVIPDASP